MKHLTILLFISIALITTANQCKKPKPAATDDGLPLATQTGANIFACKVNGNNWIVKTNIYKLGTSFSRSNNRDTLSFFGAGTPDTLLDLITFTIKTKIQQGVSYRLNDTTKALVNTLRLFATCGPTSGYGGSQWNYGTDGYITITKFSGTYTVPGCCTYGTYDRNAIISGTFNFVIAIPNCDSIKVTDGRFDINYSNY